MTELGLATVMTEEIHQEEVVLDHPPMTILAPGVVTEMRGLGVSPALMTVSLKVTPRTATIPNSSGSVASANGSTGSLMNFAIETLAEGIKGLHHGAVRQMLVTSAGSTNN